MKDGTSTFEQIKGRLFSYLLRASGDYDLSRDLLQETFSRYLAHYRGRAVAPSLFFTIARNAFIDHARKNRRSVPLETDCADGSSDVGHQVLVRERYRQVLDALEHLADDEREVLSLVVSCDLSYCRIAEIMDTSEGNVKVKVHRARCKLREILQGGGDA